MDSHEEEDMVVREIDVYFTPKIDDNTNLLLVQYPLRPQWRPYGLEERCLEVRIKPEHKRFEVDMVLDTSSSSFNADVPSHLKIEKQTLTASNASKFDDASYAIGILKENSLYLTPLSEIMQLRHSFEYLNEIENAKKNKSKNENANNKAMDLDDLNEEKDEKNELETVQVSIMKKESEEEEQQRLQSFTYLKAKEDEEPWILLSPFANWSAESDTIREKLLNSQNEILNANQTPSQYIESLVPPRSSDEEWLKQTDGNGVLGLSKQFLNTLPLKDKILSILTKGKVQVFSFDRILCLLSSDSRELTSISNPTMTFPLTLKVEVLRILSSTCYNVQGHWVTGSKLFLTREQCCIRDYLLLLFFQKRKIKREELKPLKVPKEMLSLFLKSIAKADGPDEPWEFLHPTDEIFIAQFPRVWEDQSEKWRKAQEAIKSRAVMVEIASEIPLKVNVKTQGGKSAPSQRNTPGGSSSTANQTVPSGSESSSKGSLSDQTTSSLLIALKNIFIKHEVCSLPFLIQSLKEYAVQISSAKKSTNEEKLSALAAAKAITLPHPELASVAERVATCLHGVYFLTSLGNPTLDPFRQVVIALFRAKGPGNGLRRGDIMEASKLALKTQVTTFVFQKVMKELSYTKGSLWMLKPGDGRPV